jgi:2,3-diketo-5-methylthio-1-phosphopentane phosphatase
MTTVLESPRQPRILITDFDGTITKWDFYERVLAEYGNKLPADGWQRYLSGELSHFEALSMIFAAVPGVEAEALRLARSTGVDPDFKASVEYLNEHGWQVLIVSAGCQWYIDRLMRDLDIDAPIISNPGRLTPTGLELMAPTDSPYFAKDTGIDKAAVVRRALQCYQHVAFAGNGRADLEAVLLVPATRRFATAWLAMQLSRMDEAFTPFDRWSQIADRLIETNRGNR